MPTDPRAPVSAPLSDEERATLATEWRVISAGSYFGAGRCSGHAQFNGRYCRDAAEPDQWCIHCVGFTLLAERDRLLDETERLRTPKTCETCGHHQPWTPWVNGTCGLFSLHPPTSAFGCTLHTPLAPVATPTEPSGAPEEPR